MEERAPRRLAPVVIWVASLLIGLSGVWIQATESVGGEAAWGFRGDEALMCLVFATTGAVLTAKRPGNAIGRIFVLLGLFSATQYLTEEYAAYALKHGITGPAIELIFWVQNLVWIGGVVLLGLLFLLFPDGELSSRAERRAARFLVFAGATTTLAWAFLPPDLEIQGLATVDNPFGLLDDAETAEAIAGPVTLLLMAALITSGVLLVIRFRRSQGIRRLQLEWFVYTGALVSVLFGLSALGVYSTVMSALAMVCVALLAVSAAIAVLRYRLYEVDIIVNRALVYGSLTAVLVVAYLALVVALQLVLEPLTSDSDLAVAASTLAVAALFRPLRARVQAFIDRRFYRRKYDSARALAEFGRRLRAEMDLDVLERDVTAVLRDTVQPAHAALWLKP